MHHVEERLGGLDGALIEIPEKLRPGERHGRVSQHRDGPGPVMCENSSALFSRRFSDRTQESANAFPARDGAGPWLGLRV
jgi:hypothetical protein